MPATLPLDVTKSCFWHRLERNLYGIHGITLMSLQPLFTGRRPPKIVTYNRPYSINRNIHGPAV